MADPNNLPGMSGHGCPWSMFQLYNYSGCTNSEFMKDQQPGVPCVRELLKEGLWKEVLDFLRENQFHDSSYHPSMLSLATCMLYKADPNSIKESSNMVATLCEIPSKLFLLTHFLQLAAHRCDYFQERNKKKTRNCDSVGSSSTTRQMLLEEHVTGGLHHLDIAAPSPIPQVDDPQPKSRKRKVHPTTPDKTRVKKPKIQSKAWGRQRRRAIASYYLNKSPMTLLYHLTKYKRRYHWSHKRLLFLSHPKLKPRQDENYEAKKLIFNYAKYGYKRTKRKYKALSIIENDGQQGQSFVSQPVNHVAHWINILEKLKTFSKEDADEFKRFLEKYCSNIRRMGTDDDFAVCWEHVPTHFLNDKEIFKHLLLNMPWMAMIRNLKRMNTLGLLSDELVVHTIKDRLDAACDERKVHPMKLLNAWLLNRNTHPESNGKVQLMNHIKTTALKLLKGSKNDAATKRKFIVAFDLSLSTNENISEHNTHSIHNLQYGLFLLAALNGIIESCGESKIYYEFFKELKTSGCLPSLEQMIEHVENNNDVMLKDIFEGKPFVCRPQACSPKRDKTKCLSLPIVEASQAKEHADAFIIITNSLESDSDEPILDAFRNYQKQVNGNAMLFILDMHPYDGSYHPVQCGLEQQQERLPQKMELNEGVLHLSAHDPNVLTKLFKLLTKPPHNQKDCPYCAKKARRLQQNDNNR